MSAGLIYSIITMPFEAARDGLEMTRDNPRWPEMARDGPRFSGLIYSPMIVSTMADELN